MNRLVQCALLAFIIVTALSGDLVATRSQSASSPTVTYSYDSLGRLVGEGYSNYTGANALSYIYDKSGNRSQDSIQ